MERKTEIMCRRVWEKVRENVEITYQIAMCDFEKASINSFMFCYPSTPLTGCFFNFSQCIWHRIKVRGDQHYTEIMKQREDNVIRSYEALEEHICLDGFEKKFR
ncbi:hypothetical protein HZS_2122 [Henneguya salminicola]|nr:hypothetical protein HZS_2122 [Henneguya salminicola]